MKRYLPLFIVPVFLFAKGEVVPIEADYEYQAPWFTGPLLASSATVVPIGHINFEPYVYCFDSPARYDDHWGSKEQKTIQEVTFEPYFWVGLTQWADLQITPAWNWKHREGPSYWTLGDWALKLEFQLYLSEIPHKNWMPSIKFGIQEIFPTGKYQKLNLKKLLTDAGGLGAYTTNFQLNFARFIHFTSVHWLQLRLNLNYAVSSLVPVQGLNVYGGWTGTKGLVRPGQQASFDVAFEYLLTRNWAIACDFVGFYQGASRFTGRNGTNPDGSVASSSLPPSALFSLAPAIEYNWSDDIGVIAGTWFTLAGKNSNKFYSGVIALNIYK